MPGQRYLCELVLVDVSVRIVTTLSWMAGSSHSGVRRFEHLFPTNSK